MKLLFSVGIALALLPMNVGAFSLLGPFADWMQSTNGFNRQYDIGGPMDLEEEYRWNVPVVTYAFDQSFLDYFGSNGVAAVEQAIQVFNDLPPASEMNLEDFPLIAEKYNFSAMAGGIRDLKSAVMEIIVEQLGLASPTRNIFVIRRYDPAPFFPYCADEPCWYSWAIPYFIVERNFDPETVTASHFVNGTLYSGQISFYLNSNVGMIAFAVDPFADPFTAVADHVLDPGKYRTGLTRDDVGGLRYLFSPTNINYETLLPDVPGAGSNANSYVNGAWRLGVNKITFLRQEYDSVLGQGVPLTNQFADVYVTNGLTVTQLLERVVVQPDFLFSVSDYDEEHAGAGYISRASATNWLNLADLNGDSTRAGPGLIRPPGEIKILRMRTQVWLSDDYWNTNRIDVAESVWGSFSDPINQPIVYPEQSESNPDYFNLTLRSGAVGPNPLMKWRVPVAVSNTIGLEISSNLVSWSRVTTITNSGVEVLFFDVRARPAQFYRLAQ